MSAKEVQDKLDKVGAKLLGRTGQESSTTKRTSWADLTEEEFG